MYLNSMLNTILFILLFFIIFLLFVYESIKYDKKRKLYESDPFDGVIDLK